ncbi:hypothetical protein CEP53_003525 [Fusarium sp. AF-6]|nr:hypothetical protein CEP53_003525 [Fusarium sp. AF-6]
MSSLNLTEPPFPLGDTEDEIRRDPKLCRTCWNLYAGSATTAVPLPGISMHEHSGFTNAAKATKEGHVDKAPTWASSGRIDYASWQIQVYLPDIPGSVASGCASCLLLTEVLNKLTNGTVDFQDPERWLEIIFCKGNAMRVKLVKGDPPDDFDMFSDGQGGDWDVIEAYELYTLPGSPCPWPTIGPCMTIEKPDWSLPAEIGGRARHVELDPASESSFDRIKRWINICKTEHAVCSEAEVKITRDLPKRVIDIGLESNDGIHVFERDNPAERIDEPYIALSHCWGKTQHLVSKKATIDERKRNIPFGIMAKTFQDAVTISRKLGIRYIWIDSLCIIQDDDDDWQTEAAKMASIYNGAELVLSATGSVDGSGGCLFKRDPYVTVSGTFPDGKPWEVYGRKTLQHSIFGWNVERNMAKGSANPIAGTQQTDVQDHPLMTRAWCFQERLLATRVLHYTKNEIVFDCLSSMECECGALEKHEEDPLIPARRIMKTGHKYITGTKSLRAGWGSLIKPLEGEHKEFDQHHELWRDLIVQYSQKQITKRMDGLPAVAGLAHEWRNDLTGKYLAGLWERDLRNHLRWMPDEAEPEPKEKKSGEKDEYIAPTWSWLSVQRGVTWGVESFIDDKFFVEVDLSRTDCEPKKIANPLGAVKSGYIFLTGRIMPLTFSVRGRTVWLEKKGHETKKEFQRPDSMSRLRNLPDNVVYCLRFCRRPTTMNAYDDDSALVLVKADAEARGGQPDEVRGYEHVYQRVGFIRNYMTNAWGHERDSEEMGLYVI